MIPPAWEILTGDVRKILAELPEEHYQTVVTSPPYWKLRDYDVEGQIGSEPTFAEWVDVLVEVLDGARRVMRKDATLWLNLGDSWNTNEHGPTNRGLNEKNGPSAGSQWRKTGRTPNCQRGRGRGRVRGLKHKDLIGQPWTLAFRLRDAGWWLRQEVVWAKPSPLPESVTDRPVRSHETVFLLTRSERYFYDHVAVREPVTGGAHPRGANLTPKRVATGGRVSGVGANATRTLEERTSDGKRNLRDVWWIASCPSAFDEHTATFPPALVEPCVLAGTSAGGACSAIGCGAPYLRSSEGAASRSWRPSCRHKHAEAIPCAVLDPFMGTGTTGEVALQHGRSAVGIELNPRTADFARERLRVAAERYGAPLFDRRKEPAHG